MYVVPTGFESILLIIIALSGPVLMVRSPDLIAFSLLFAMGMQNSLVTSISNAVVRTTHLTGLFTDLGIELSQLFFYKTSEQKGKLMSSIKLRLSIISFFFIGGIIGGVCYTKIGIYTLCVVAIALILGLIYDDIKFILIKRRYGHSWTIDLRKIALLCF